MNLKKLKPLLFVALLISLFTSCAAAGNMIGHGTWMGMLDLFAAGGIALYIFRGTNK